MNGTAPTPIIEAPHCDGARTIVFGATAEVLTPSRMAELTTIMKQGHSSYGGTLGGRACISVGEVTGIGRVVAKQYQRGGILRHLLAASYLKTGPIRSRVEYEVLEHVRSLGVRAPKPVAYAYQGGFFYQAWLFTQEIPSTTTIAQLSMSEDERVREAFPDILQQIITLIEHRVFHIDLHPGNVLLNERGESFILDFDKAAYVSGSRNQLRDRYLCRWRRAVLKHGLPDYLTELMSHGLRRTFAE
jgi:hypothetical protein